MQKIKWIWFRIREYPGWWLFVIFLLEIFWVIAEAIVAIKKIMV
ncbi:hypothetical protein [Sinanaerobacter sp. ZZT-01]|nr:hypothetical protein [Sinanaerobacter sp. ZZT-01]WRR94174.1 hypothetical protein U5921_03385 [Sinanaerobacter sp. ZZT-01]